MAFGESLVDSKLPEHIVTDRRQILLGSAIWLATQQEIDGRPIDDDERAKFTKNAGKLFLDTMALEQQADYVGNHFGVKLKEPGIGVVAGNLPADPEDDTAYTNLRALHVLVGEELVNAQQSN